MGVLDEHTVFEGCVRRMNGRVRPAGVEIFEIVSSPRGGSRGRPLERDVRPIRELVNGRAVLPVALTVLFLADVVIRIARPERG